MATIQHIEKSIERVEGFQVRLLHGRDGRDVRSDKRGTPGYPYQRRLDGERTVKDWCTTRFQKCYPGYDVEVLTPAGEVAHGRTKLANLRNAWLNQ